MKKSNFDFIGKRKYAFTFSACLMALGLIFNFIFGTQLDIQFVGGAIVSYTYTGSIDGQQVEDMVQEVTGRDVDVQTNQDVMLAGSENTVNQLSLEFAGNNALSLEQQREITSRLQEQYPEQNVAQSESNSVDPSMGQRFLLKCVFALALASILMMVYVAFRFKKMGWSAGVMALVALLIDIITVYFTFIIFRIPVDDNFIAVALTILGYSLNDTIIIYDRIREKRRTAGPKTDLAQLVNESINQNLGRTINTSLFTFLAVACVFVVSLVYNLPSVTAFALPMMVGVVSGCYTTNFLVGPLWVMWKGHVAKRRAAKAEA